MGIITKINWIDILAVIIVVRISYVALQDGLSHEIFPLIGAVLTAAMSIHYYRDLASFAQNMVSLPIPLLNMLAFLTLVIGLGLIFKLARALVDALMKVTWHPLAEKSGGLIFGLLRASVVVSIVFTLMSLTPLSYLQYSIKERSLTGSYFLKVAPGISSKLAWAFPTINKK